MGRVLEFLNDHEDRPFDVLNLARELKVQKSVVRGAANMLHGEQKVARGGEGLKSNPYIYASVLYRGELSLEAVKNAER
jgi:hypothetical protein